MKAERKTLGLPPHLHKGLKDLSDEAGIPITIIIEHWLQNFSEQDWSSLREDYNKRKPTWRNIRRIVREYMEKYPEAKDSELASLTGYSLRQVETITLSAHKRCLDYLEEHPKAPPNVVSKDCNVSIAFATLIQEKLNGDRRIPKSERHLFGEDPG